MLIFLTVLEGEFAPKDTVDDTLIETIAGGDMTAFHQLYTIASGSIYGFALSITKNSHDAEDVLQDTFLAIHKFAGNYKPQGKPMAWIFTIARNCALMKLRNKEKNADLDRRLMKDNDGFSRIKSVEDRMLIKALLNTLESEERQIVMLRSVSDMKNKEIASLLGLPLNTVLSKYHRAIKKLRNSNKKGGFSQ